MNYIKKFLLIFVNIATLLLSQNEVCFDIETNPNPNNSALECFSKYVNVLDCIHIYAESSVQDNKVFKVTSSEDHSVTNGHLCVKGRFGFQFIQNLKEK